jgi:putative membrane protein (TIGR04086 family)
MTPYLDLKALAYGIATFVLGYLALMVATNVAAYSPPQIARVAVGLMQASVNLIPALAGYVAARRASSRPIVHGTVAGVLGTALYIVVTSHVFPEYPTQQIPMLLAAFALLAALGAIFGKHRRDKAGRGPRPS